MSFENFRQTVTRLVANRRAVRVAFVLVVVIGLVPTGLAYAAGDQTVKGATEEQIRSQSVAPRDGVTVVTTDAYGGGRITAFAPDGDVLYYDDRYSLYHDVDPSSTGTYNVTYVATEYPIQDCQVGTSCAASFVEEANLSTGERTRLWERIRPATGTFGIHDVDRIGPHRLLVADIANPDMIYVVNTTSGVREWAWSPQSAFDIGGGGAYPGDWTHVNNVQYLGNGTVTASLRNQDQVVFVNRRTGLIEGMTLGAENDRRVLYEQHNPDYIPAARGGPALLVADSENGRIVEYQRANGSWEQSWLWRDTKMQWPRDADRLPNGHTLVVDTNSDRVVEVDQQGEVVWELAYPGPYEAERLGTGDESASGSSAAALGLESRGQTLLGTGKEAQNRNSGGFLATVVFAVQALLPRKLVNAVLYVLPAWATPLSVLGMVGSVSALGLWAVTELYWSRWSVRSPVSLGE
jgi:hypothetical protein